MALKLKPPETATGIGQWRGHGSDHPRSFAAWVRGRFFERREVQGRLQAILQHLRTLLAA
jgi:hypothetical protein